MSGPIARILGIALIASSASIATPANSASTERFEDGLAAYERNDYEKSLKMLRPLAEKGDARAQYLIGRQYQFGQGTKANRAEAYFWYKRAEAKGHAEAKLFRQLLEKRWNISATDRAVAERKLTEANAPPKTAKAEPKPKPEKPQVATAVARETPKPEITSKPSERAKPAEKPAIAAAKAPASEEPPATLRSRLEPTRPAQPPARDDDDDTQADSVTTSVPPSRTMPPAEIRTMPPADTRTMPPAETRTAMAPPGNPGHTAPRNYPDNDAPPVYAPPAYAPPGYAPPTYSAPPYYAPSAPPTWNPPPYYAARPYYRPVWRHQPYRAYVHLGWRGFPGAGHRRGRW